MFAIFDTVVLRDLLVDVNQKASLLDLLVLTRNIKMLWLFGDFNTSWSCHFHGCSQDCATIWVEPSIMTESSLSSLLLVVRICMTHWDESYRSFLSRLASVYSKITIFSCQSIFEIVRGTIWSYNIDFKAWPIVQNCSIPRSTETTKVDYTNPWRKAKEYDWLPLWGLLPTSPCA